MPEKEKFYRYKYEPGQTTTERLRNKLCSVFNIVQLLANPRAKGLLNENAVRIANEDLVSVRDLIEDIETDYERFKECQGNEDNQK